MAVRAQTSDLAHPEPVAQAGAAFGQLQGACFPIGMGKGLWCELTWFPVGARVFVISEDGNALGFESGKEVRGVAFTVEDQGEAVPEGIGGKFLGRRLAGNIIEKSWHDFFFEGFLQPGVHDFGHAKKGGSVERVDPVVGRAAQAKLLATDITPRQFGRFAVIDAHITLTIGTPKARDISLCEAVPLAMSWLLKNRNDPLSSIR